MVLGKNWSSASIVIVILFNNKTPAGGYKIPGVTLVFQNTMYLGGKTFYDYKKYKLSLLVCGLQSTCLKKLETPKIGF